MNTKNPIIKKHTSDTIIEMWNRVEQITTEKNMHINSIADACGMSPSAIYFSIRAAKRGEIVDNPLSTILTLADALGVSLDSLLCDKALLADCKTSANDKLRSLLGKMSPFAKNQLRVEMMTHLLLH